MAVEDMQGLSAGWYKDPEEESVYRYWDGGKFIGDSAAVSDGRPSFVPEPEVGLSAETDSDGILTLEGIIKADDVSEEKFWIPEWKGYVVLRSMSQRQIDRIRKTAKSRSGKYNESMLQAMVTMAGMVKPEVKSTVDYDVLKDKSASAMSRIFNRIMNTSLDTEDSAAEAEEEF